eukprot:scaffold325468_cov22-Prasinocladus_malaysianus.AAC.1
MVMLPVGLVGAAKLDLWRSSRAVSCQATGDNSATNRRGILAVSLCHAQTTNSLSYLEAFLRLSIVFVSNPLPIPHELAMDAELTIN